MHCSIFCTCVKLIYPDVTERFCLKCWQNFMRTWIHVAPTRKRVATSSLLSTMSLRGHLMITG